MAVLAEYLRCSRGKTAEIYSEISGKKPAMTFMDCSHRKGEIFQKFGYADLFVVNLSVSDRKIENIFFKHSFVQKNVVFLFGKYFHKDADALRAFAKNFRVDMGRICTIPYNMRFQQAYEHHKLPAYLLQKKCSYEDEVFKQNLFQTMRTILMYASI